MTFTRLLRSAVVPSLAVTIILFTPAFASARTGSAQGVTVAGLSSQVAQLDSQLNLAVAQYAAAAQRLQTLQQTIAADRKGLRLAQYQLDLARQSLADRAAASYKAQSVSLLDVVFGSGSFEDLMSNLDFVRRIDARDAQVVTTVDQQAASVRKDLTALTAEQTRLQGTLKELDRRRTAIGRLLSRRQQALAGAKARLAAAASPSPSPVAQPTPPAVSPLPTGGWWPAIQAAAKANGVKAQGLYRLMMIESGGVATISNGVNVGLFQYAPGTWHGDWNPWRARPITDGGAQIKATALAVHLGYGPSWWAASYSYAFSGN